VAFGIIFVMHEHQALRNKGTNQAISNLGKLALGLQFVHHSAGQDSEQDSKIHSMKIEDQGENDSGGELVSLDDTGSDAARNAQILSVDDKTVHSTKVHKSNKGTAAKLGESVTTKLVAGRRGGGALMTSGSFTMMSSNRAGNSEDEEDEYEEDLAETGENVNELKAQERQHKSTAAELMKRIQVAEGKELARGKGTSTRELGSSVGIRVREDEEEEHDEELADTRENVHEDDELEGDEGDTDEGDNLERDGESKLGESLKDAVALGWGSTRRRRYQPTTRRRRYQPTTRRRRTSRPRPDPVAKALAATTTAKSASSQVSSKVPPPSPPHSVSCSGDPPVATFTWLESTTGVHKSSTGTGTVFNQANATCTRGVCQTKQTLTSGQRHEEWWVKDSSGSLTRYNAPYWCWSAVKNFVLNPLQSTWQHGWRYGQATSMSGFAVANNCGAIPCPTSTDYNPSGKTMPRCQTDPAKSKCGPGGAHNTRVDPSPDAVGFHYAYESATRCSSGAFPMVRDLMQNSGRCIANMDASGSGYTASNFLATNEVVCAPSEPGKKSFRTVCTKNQLKWNLHQWAEVPNNGDIRGASLCMVTKQTECFTLADGTQECSAKKNSQCKETCYVTSGYNKYTDMVCRGNAKSIPATMLNRHVGGKADPNSWFKDSSGGRNKFCCFTNCIIPNNAPKFLRTFAETGFCAQPTKMA